MSGAVAASLLGPALLELPRACCTSTLSNTCAPISNLLVPRGWKRRGFDRGSRCTFAAWASTAHRLVYPYGEGWNAQAPAFPIEPHLGSSFGRQPPVESTSQVDRHT